jgi:hypothetical protein
MRAEGPRRLGDIDFRQASFDSKFGSDSRKKDGAQKERHREVTFDALGDELIPTNEPMATQQKDASKLKIVRGTPDSADPFGETAMSNTLLQPKVRIVEGTPLPQIELSDDEQRRIEEVRKRIAESGSRDNMDRPRKSA